MVIIKTITTINNIFFQLSFLKAFLYNHLACVTIYMFVRVITYPALIANFIAALPKVEMSLSIYF